MKMTLSRIFAACVILLIATVPAFAAPMYEVLHSFLQGPYFPASPLVQATDGNFYGTTEQGGVSNNGTIFRMTPAGAFTTLVEFTGNGASNKGRQPDGVLVQGSDGNFYGTTYYGGVRNFGTIFKMTPAGVLTTLVEFSNNAAVNKGAYPQAGLVLGTDGNFYGTTSGGGTIGSGTVFKMTGAGVLTTLLEFNGTTNKGSNPQAGLMQGSDGNFYGTTYYGGVSDFGTIFKMTPAGVLTTLVEFTDSGATNGSYPYFGTLVQGSDGNFYGMTSRGGANGVGTVFKMTPAGVLTTLVEFTWNLSTNKGGSPYGGLVQGSDGNFYGTTNGGGSGQTGTAFKMTPAGVLTTLVEFGNTLPGPPVSLSSNPRAALVQGSDGNFYGTVSGGAGGASGGAGTGGAIFKMTAAGALTTLVKLPANSATYGGRSPQAELVQGTDGNFYGTTYYGGANELGTIFKMTPAGLTTTLIEFTGNGSSNKGASPQAGLVQGRDGNFYGTTSFGGANGYGTVFKMTPAGGLTTLVEFTWNGASNKGTYPNATLIQGSDDNFYGTTTGGGASNFGTVFKMTPAGALTTLVEFDSTNHIGLNPESALVQGVDGNYFGTTYFGGTTNFGTVFKITPTGVLTTLVEFTNSGATNKGAYPKGLIQGSDGNFYGTTWGGGASAFGTVFKMTPAGVLTTLVEFAGNATPNRGSGPNGLVQGSDGNFYGTTYWGGDANTLQGIGRPGTIFVMTPTGELTTLVDLAYWPNGLGAIPYARLIKGADNSFYGTTQYGGSGDGGTVFKVDPLGAPINNADLASLVASPAGITPIFAPGTTSYTLSVSNATASMTVTPAVASNDAQVQVNGVSVASGTASGSINLAVGFNVITVNVTALDNFTTKSYSIFVRRASLLNNNADLTSLVPSPGPLAPGFSNSITSYTESVPNSTASMTVTPTVAQANATVKVNGTTVASGTASGAIVLNVGTNTITTVVTAQDGVTTKTYAIIVTRAGSLSNNSDLASLVPSTGTLVPGFSSGTLIYTEGVSNATASMTVTPTVADSTATVTVNGFAVTSGTASGVIALNVGANVITTMVTAQDGVTTKTYTVTVMRATPPSNNADLSSLLPSAGTLSPAFSNTITSYTESVPNATASMAVTPTVAQANATVTVNGTTVASGTASGSIALNVGANIITTVVTAQDGVTTKNYTITITRANPVSNNADLASLVPSTGTPAPVFSNTITSYTESVPNATASMTVTPTVAQANATVKVNGTAVASGTASGSIALNVGANVITTVATAQDGVTTKTYMITVTRAAALSNNADLASLLPSAGTLAPAFASGTNATASITVTPTVAQAGATVKVNGTTVASGSASAAIALAVGVNPAISIVVTAQDGITAKTYTLTVTRAVALSNNADLASLLPSAGTLAPAFASGTLAYTASVSNATASITITPTVAQANATVQPSPWLWV
ncbi:MAG: cadherin-like beta sandwich domain-containing protein [Verrucomicrobia bacterium]|nr:cadherin-like beta sandwich domain-containing protein [Verrucomicrobiota bacterium]